MFLDPATIFINMFTQKGKRETPPGEPEARLRRGPGRPPGRTAQGAQSREQLYKTAIELIAEQGYEATTLRDIARNANVSVGLLYRYFPSKRAVVLALYDRLSAEHARRALRMPDGKWRHRFLFALRTSLEVLGPHRSTLAALVPVLVGDPGEGLFAPNTAFSRLRVQKAFSEAAVSARDAPRPQVAAALGRLLYLVQLTVILWWLLDRSPRQRATEGLIALIERVLPAVAVALRLRPARAGIVLADALFRDALLPDIGDEKSHGEP